MKIHRLSRFIVLVALLAASGFACGGPQNQPHSFVQAVPTQTAADTLSPTAPRQGASPTPPPLPSLTPETILPTDPPASAGSVLSPQNAAELTLIDIWGLGSPQGLEWSPDGSQLVLGFQSSTLVFDANAGRQVLGLPCDGWLTGIDISPDGQTLVVLHSNGTIEFYNLSTGELISSHIEITPNRPVSLQYTPDGAALLVGLDEGLVGSVAFDGQEAAIGIFGDPGYPVESLAISPDLTRLVGMSNDLGLSVWQIEDLLNPQFLYNLAGTANTGPFLSVAFSPNGCWLVASTWDGLLFLWDLSAEDSSQKFQTLWPQVDGFDLPGAWTSLAFSTDSRTLASGADNGELWLWDMETAQPRLSVPAGQSTVSFLAYSPDGKRLAAMFSDGQSVLFDSSSLDVKHNLPTEPAWGGSVAAVSSDGRFMATATQAYLGDGLVMRRTFDGTGLYLRSFPDGSIIRQMDTGGFVATPSGFTSLALSPDGSWLAAQPQGLPLAVWDASSEEMAYIVEDFNDAAYSCSQVLFSPDGLSIATACHGNQVMLRQTVSGEFQRSFQAGEAEFITTLDFSPDGAWLAGAGGNGPVYLWNLVDAAVRILESFDPAPITSLSFSPDGRFLANTTGRDIPQVLVWDTASDEQVTALGFNDTVTAAVFSPDSRLLAIAVDFEFFDVLEIWDWQAQAMLAHERYDTELTQVFFSPDGSFVTTVSEDGLLRIWGLAP